MDTVSSYFEFFTDAMEVTVQQVERKTTVMFRGETRTILSKLCPFQEFEACLLSQLNITSNIAIKYLDTEKDWIVVGCDEDVKDALSAFDVTLQVCERAAPSDERDVNRSLIPSIPPVPKRSSVLKRRESDTLGNSGASGSTHRRDGLFHAREVDTIIPSKAAQASRFIVPDTAEMDSELLAAHQRRLQNRAYESRAVRIGRFYQTSSSKDPAATNTSTHQRKPRVRWGAGCSGLGSEVAHDPAFAQVAKASPREVGPSPKAQLAETPPPSPAPLPRPSYDAVAASPPVRQHSLAVAAPPTSRGRWPEEPLVGVGLSLSTTPPFVVLDGSVLRDGRGVLQGASGYSNPVPIEPHDW
jgi:hypothetical protein